MMGVSTSTLRRWDRRQQLRAAYRTVGGHRRYDLQVIATKIAGKETTTKPLTVTEIPVTPVVTYARVSAAKQRNDLTTQHEHLKAYAEQHGWNVVHSYQDIGSGLNDQRKGLLQLLRDLPILRPTKIVVSYSDRLARFGITIIQLVGTMFGAEVVTTHTCEEQVPFDQQLVQDMIALVTSFAGKLHRSRRGQQTTDFASSKG